jgi:nucleotide-binding universal stress UspA family protein
MYEHILIPLENSAADQTIIDHIRPLARLTGAKLLLVHVANGWAARNFEQLNLAESEEIKEDRAYLKTRCQELARDGFKADAVLAMGEPSEQIIKLSRERQVDLIAMSTHGHRFLKDVLLGQTVEKVRHTLEVPVLLLKART